MRSKFSVRVDASVVRLAVIVTNICQIQNKFGVRSVRIQVNVRVQLDRGFG